MTCTDDAEVEPGDTGPFAARRRPTRTWLAAATVVAVVVGGGGAALANHARPQGAVATGMFTDGLDVKFKVEDHHGVDVTAVKGPGEAIVQQINMGQGQSTGWHTHGGPVVVVVETGSFTLYSTAGDECHEHTYTAGQAFIDPGDGHVHLGQAGEAGAELWATYLLPAGASPRIVAEAPPACTE